MFTIRFTTTAYRPDALVTLRTEAGAWTDDAGGVYQDGAWVFRLDEADYGGVLTFKFVLERSYWMLGDNLAVAPVPGADYAFDEGNVKFPPYDGLIVENSRVQEVFFPPALDEQKTYDVIVVGSGIGGGILADQLSDLGLDVLVLEAGSYLFPTHVANLPRRHLVGRFDKHIWGLYGTFKVVNYTNAPGSAFEGGQAFNLGGRSVFWGGFIPRMSGWEFHAWPAGIRQYLEGPGYARAEDVMNRTGLPSSPWNESVKQTLAQRTGDFVYFDAPMAVQYSGLSAASIPAGMFSTADLLTESALTADPVGREGLTVNLNHAVVRVETDGGRATAVVAHDLISNTFRSYKARHVALCAGTLESAKIALMSGLRDPNGKAGVGLTDHLIRYIHFALPPSSPLYSSAESAKLLAQHPGADKDHHAFNVLLELGADLNQGRFVDDEILAEHRRRRGDTMLCELVFLFDQRLVETNRLRHAGPPVAKPEVLVRPGADGDRFRAETDALTGEIVDALGGIALVGEDLVLDDAGLGIVAHEVGTLRLGAGGTGVVDEDLRFLEYENLYACDLSVFPSSPAANPTLTLAALAIRLADHIKARA
ncbi:MAG TPA: GMC oxidoreductase [Actinomycetota bacterium]|nr:GMC oxidoreductase [Actinomycetota bacterium]